MKALDESCALNPQKYLTGDDKLTSFDLVEAPRPGTSGSVGAMVCVSRYVLRVTVIQLLVYLSANQSLCVPGVNCPHRAPSPGANDL